MKKKKKKNLTDHTLRWCRTKPKCKGGMRFPRHNICYFCCCCCFRVVKFDDRIIDIIRLYSLFACVCVCVFLYIFVLN